MGRLRENVVRWSTGALVLVGLARDAGGRVVDAAEAELGARRARRAEKAEDVAERDWLKSLAPATLRAMQARGLRVAATLSSAGWSDIEAELLATDKKILENFVDPSLATSVKSWEQCLTMQGAARQHRNKMREPYEIVRRGLRAENELERRGVE